MILRKFLSRCYHTSWMYLHILQFRLSGKNKENREKILMLKDKYAGRRCFIVCNGPSLRIEDLNKIHEHGDISIGINLIGRIQNQTAWRPTVLNAVDACIFLPKNKGVVEKTECEVTIYSQEDYYRVKNWKGNKCFLYLKRSRKYLDAPQFSTELEKYVYSIGTSTYQAIEVAAYMGCKEIYIIGCDMSYAANISRDGKITYNDAGRNHFYAAKDDSMKQIEPYPIWEMETAFDAARMFGDKLGICIYNATRGGKLESFERVDFDSLF